jgi:hypothetical protein
MADKNKQWLRVKRWTKIFQAKQLCKQAGVAVVISDKADFELKLVRRLNGGHFILIKGQFNKRK